MFKWDVQNSTNAALPELYIVNNFSLEPYALQDDSRLFDFNELFLKAVLQDLPPSLAFGLFSWITDNVDGREKLNILWNPLMHLSQFLQIT